MLPEYCVQLDYTLTLTLALTLNLTLSLSLSLTLSLTRYYVELDYTLKHHTPEREPTAAQLQELGGGLGGPVHSESEAIDMSNLTRPLLRFVRQCKPNPNPNPNPDPDPNPNPNPNQVRQCKLASTADPYDELCTAALNMPPPLPQRPKVHTGSRSSCNANQVTL